MPMRPFLDITIGLYTYTILYNYPKSSKHIGNKNGNPKEHLLIPNFWTSIGPFFSGWQPMFHSVSMPARPGELPASCRPSRPSHASHASHASRSCSSYPFRLGASGVAMTVVLQRRFEMRWQRRHLGIRWLRCAPTEVATCTLAFGKKQCAVRIFCCVFFGKWGSGEVVLCKGNHKKMVSPQVITTLDVIIFPSKNGL